MFKVKHERTADVVIAGYREHKSGPIVGSLLLGLYGPDGRLHHVGVAASFPMARRAELVEELTPYLAKLGEHPWGEWADQALLRVGQPAATPSSGGQRMPGAVSRWNAKKDLSFIPLRARAGDRGGLRQHGGRQVPAHRAVPPLAAGPDARILHV
ncbi:hypothetical protein [Nonomuraea dietziae]|uniref:hypothetical protein n=1 Tax=Nonomuraea dietziae TaxID=65515 RepID=UPI0031DF9BEB